MHCMCYTEQMNICSIKSRDGFVHNYIYTIPVFIIIREVCSKWEGRRA